MNTEQDLTSSPHGSNTMLAAVFCPPFRVGRKQKRAILDANGKEVVIFPVGQEKMAKDYCDFLNGNNKVTIPYQLCPKCNGQGTVSKPPYVAGDVFHWSDTSCTHQCDVCNGNKIIPMYVFPKLNAVDDGS